MLAASLPRVGHKKYRSVTTKEPPKRESHLPWVAVVTSVCRSSSVTFIGSARGVAGIVPYSVAEYAIERWVEYTRSSRSSLAVGSVTAVSHKAMGREGTGMNNATCVAYSGESASLSSALVTPPGMASIYSRGGLVGCEGVVP